MVDACGAGDFFRRYTVSALIELQCLIWRHKPFSIPSTSATCVAAGAAPSLAAKSCGETPSCGSIAISTTKMYQATWKMFQIAQTFRSTHTKLKSSTYRCLMLTKISLLSMFVESARPLKSGRLQHFSFTKIGFEDI